MSIEIGLMGDVMIGRLVDEFLNQAPPESIWGDLLPILRKTDLNLINLETTLTNSQNAVPKVFNFKADPHKVASLLQARIDVVNLANNHVLDYSEEGLIETLKVLDRVNIQHVGAGVDLESARHPVILEKRGISIGILGYTDNQPDWNAEKNRPGVRYIHVGDLATVLSDIRPLREKVDILIVSIHWGPNMVEHPPQSFVNFAHRLIENGVDILHGHSAHIFQRYEEYQKGLILYDTGDFIDDYYVDPLLRNDRSFLFLVEVSKRGYRRLHLIPTVIRDFCVHRAIGREAGEIQEHMKKLCRSAFGG